MSKRIITLGEVMMRLSTPGHERFIQTQNYEVQFGGAEANVAASLAYWGQSVAHICAFPDHEIGRAGVRYLRSSNIDTSFVFQEPTFDMPNIVDRVGGGDAFMAGLIFGLLNKADKEALAFALAASVLKHSISGDANFVTLEEVEHLVKGENVGKLLR